MATCEGVAGTENVWNGLFEADDPAACLFRKRGGGGGGGYMAIIYG